MSSFQSIIKVFAVCLAVFIIINIFGAIIFGLGIFTTILSGDKIEHSHQIEVSESYTQTYSNVREIKIDLIVSRLTIKRGDELRVEVNTSKIPVSSKVINDTLKIEETRTSSFWRNNFSGNIVLYVPEDMDLRKLELETGAGKINIDGIIAKEAEISHGAGLLEISNCTFNETEIDGGAGRISIENSRLNNLKLKAGVGKVDLGAEITGRSKIECGVGEMSVRLKGMPEEYKIMAEKGIGSLRINGENASSNTTYGNGANLIKLEGGVGSINVHFEN